MLSLVYRHDILVAPLSFLGFAMKSHDRVRPLLGRLHFSISFNIYLHLLTSIYAHHLNPAIPIPEGSSAHASP